jgi:lysophospholipase L1-like esterase
MNSLFIENKMDYKVIPYGFSGKKAQEMLPLLKNVITKHVNLEYVFILGGTNDLAFSKDPEKISQYIIDLHEYCFSKNLKTICISIPNNFYVF